MSIVTDIQILRQKSERAYADEVTRLREENGTQAERIKQLERTLTVMRTRMGISQGSR